MVKIPKETDSIVNLSGGFECLAALWYAKKKGYKPVCLALYNPNAKGKFADAESYLRKSLDLDPNNSNSLYNLGCLLIYLKKYNDDVFIL